MSSTSPRRLTTLVLAMGSTGGAFLIVAKGLVGTGKEILGPYVLLLLLAAALIRAERIASYFARFAVLFGTFVLSTLCLYVLIALSPDSSHLSVFEHAWRLVFVAGLGALLALPLARLTATPVISPAT